MEAIGYLTCGSILAISVVLFVGWLIWKNVFKNKNSNNIESSAKHWYR